MIFGLEIYPIRYFLEQNLKEIDSEYDRIFAIPEETFTYLEEQENLLYPVMERENIVIRATYYELNALVERKLKSFARKPLIELDTKKKRVFSVSLNKLVSLIEAYYKVNIHDYPEFSDVTKIREISNAYKHRNGYKDFRKGNMTNLLEQHKLDREEVARAIESCERFEVLLHQLIGKE